MVVARRTATSHPHNIAASIDDAGAPRILVVQSCPVTPIGVVGVVAEEAGVKLTTLFLHRGEALPRGAAGFDGMIILGGLPCMPATTSTIRRSASCCR